MANRDIPSGFTNIQSKVPSSEPFVTTRTVSGARVFKGDPVNFGVDGTVSRVGNGASAAEFEGISLQDRAVGESCICVDNLSAITAEIQFADGTANITTDVRGQTYDIIQAAGDTTTGQSGCELDPDNGTGGGGVCRVTDMVTRADNDLSAVNNKVRVEFNFDDVTGP